MFAGVSLDPFSKAAAILENIVEFVMILSERGRESFLTFGSTKKIAQHHRGNYLDQRNKG